MLSTSFLVRFSVVFINSAALTKARLWEAAYSQALNQNKIDRQGVKIQRVGQADSQPAMVEGVGG